MSLNDSKLLNNNPLLNDIDLNQSPARARNQIPNREEPVITRAELERQIHEATRPLVEQVERMSQLLTSVVAPFGRNNQARSSSNQRDDQITNDHTQQSSTSGEGNEYRSRNGRYGIRSDRQISSILQPIKFLVWLKASFMDFSVHINTAFEAKLVFL